MKLWVQTVDGKTFEAEPVAPVGAGDDVMVARGMLQTGAIRNLGEHGWEMYAPHQIVRVVCAEKSPAESRARS